MTKRLATVAMTMLLGLCVSATAQQRPASQWTPASPSNYTVGRGGNAVHYVVIHITEGSFSSAVNWFANPASHVSAHYVISSTGQVDQCVSESNTAWHAGNWTYNQQSIGIEHEGMAEYNSWTDVQYRTSAQMTRALCAAYGIPMDRTHILGHNEVPGATHICPGPYFNWVYYMQLVTAGGAAPPAITHPASGSTLTSSSATFTWSAGSGNTQYWLYVGSTAGGYDLFDQDMGSQLTATVSGLPTDGRSLYVRLWYLTGGAWRFLDATYTAFTGSVPPAITSPTPGSTLASSSETFTWSAGSGNTQYWLYIGSTAGGYDLYDQNMGTSLSASVAGLPTDGRTLYVRLWYLSGAWQFRDVTYTAANSGPVPPAMTSPTPGTALSSSSVTFTWSAGSGNSQYWLYIGSTAGGYDLLNQDMSTSLSVTASGLPTDGRVLYVRLWFLTGGAWQYTDYSYTASF